MGGGQGQRSSGSSSSGSGSSGGSGRQRAAAGGSSDVGGGGIGSGDVGGRGSASGDVSGSGRGGGGGKDSKWRTMRPSLPFSRVWKHLRRNPSRKRKGRKSKFLFTAQLLRKTNLENIFSDSRSVRIAHKNKKGKIGQIPSFLKSGMLISHRRQSTFHASHIVFELFLYHTAQFY
jgi:hypothetical protein